MSPSQIAEVHDEKTLAELGVSAFVRAGSPLEAARRVARSLIDADRRGHASHGLVRVLEYVEAIESGRILPAEQPEVISRSGASAVVDGRWGWGHLAADLAARTAADLAEEFGCAQVSVRRCNHSGRLGEWVEEIARRRMIGIGLLSCGPAVSPLGAHERVLGTNPIAVAIPAADDKDMVVLDFATSAVAEGKIRVAARRAESLAEGLVQTAAGDPTTDPADFYSGGSILPFGAHKGYALSVVVQIIGEALTGAAADAESLSRSNGLVLIAVDPSAAGSWTQFLSRTAATRARIRTAAPNPGAEVLLPGDVEYRHIQNLPTGRLPIDTALWQDLHRVAGLPEPQGVSSHG